MRCTAVDPRFKLLVFLDEPERNAVYDALAEEVYQNILKSDSTHQLARQALNKLRRKIAYLRLVAERKRELKEAGKMKPPVLERKTSNN